LADRYFQHTFPNGLILLAEQMPGMQSSAMTVLVPAGASNEAADRSGSTTVLAELMLRGAGNRDNRQLTDYLDSLGLQRSSGVGVHHTRFACAGLGSKVVEAISTYADIVRRPRLPEDGFGPSRDLALQALAGIDDEPRQKLLIKLREWHLPSPYGRNTLGEKDHLEKLTLDFCRADYARRFHAKDVIVAIAGNVDFDQVRSEVERHLGDWNGRAVEQVKLMPAPGPYHFDLQKTEQTHIGIAYDCVPETHEDYYTARMAIDGCSPRFARNADCVIRSASAIRA
jgi:predicted Zn-dependent peptidase